MSTEDVGRQLSSSAASKLHTREDGSLNVMASIGGVRGLLEAALPAAFFLVTFVVTDDLAPALIIALVLAGVFAVGRLLQRGPLIQSLSGLAGVGICALAAMSTGDGRDFYAPGFFINGSYILAFIVSILVRWPIIGLLFGLVRGEGMDWRKDTVRRRRYALATWIIVVVMAARLIVQVPMYLADDVAALGVARLVMGMPLYALALWVCWMITRPEPQIGRESTS
ncbi:DUF3159 domain-containing protein [Nesterenkonia cremea]|uniref:DUF3159 domain-containing protein n=1 Tax=Nesterenkonia cremea TaxID=1882340 RepID=A0A917ET51_9MICC|nr:DUF3159 domain-containing protein [Nesterenkonia cremea]GGE77351.1 hypothetical protein GCM10011401_25880 [Nesterenkonia cremea]